VNPKSAKALVSVSAICLLLVLVVMSPAGGLFLYALAALAALIPTIFGKGKLRFAGAVALAAALALLAVTYPKYAAEMTRYKQRAQQKP